MRIIILITTVLTLSIVSCNKATEDNILMAEVPETSIDIDQYEIFGEEFTVEELLSNNEMRVQYEQMEVGDSIEVSFNAKVNSICQKKGCWMKLDLGDNESESFVKFKDYDFFVPMDASFSDAVIKGVAYKGETSVEELKHYAEDAGDSQEEIDKITEARIEYTFVADGVYLKKAESES